MSFLAVEAAKIACEARMFPVRASGHLAMVLAQIGQRSLSQGCLLLLFSYPNHVTMHKCALHILYRLALLLVPKDPPRRC